MNSKRELFKLLLFNSFLGIFTGYFILHPLSMVLHNRYTMQNPMPVGDVLELTFSPKHLPMSLFFMLLGLIMGVLLAMYLYRENQKYMHWKEQSDTDPLTGLYNRRYLIDRLKQETMRSKRYRRPMSLLMIDVDDFKLFNDTYGHIKGDLILRLVALTLRSIVREPDVIARYAGDEFIVILPESNAKEAGFTAERIQAELVKVGQVIKFSEADLKITLSIGVTEYTSDIENLDALIEKVDQAMYAAKTQGKNRIFIA